MRSDPVRVLEAAAVCLIIALGGCSDAPTPLEPLHEVDGRMELARTPGLPFSEAMAELGDEIFDDQNLSIGRNQGCNACHAAEWGFTGPDPAINGAGAVYEGSIAGAFGDRKPPSSAYATLSPTFHLARQARGLFVGGNFWDGRATGERLGSPAAEQAQGPFLNPLEQALPDAACVVYRVREESDYIDDYVALWGDAITTIAFPKKIVSTACHQLIPPPISDDASMYVGMQADIEIQSAAMLPIRHFRRPKGTGARSEL